MSDNKGGIVDFPLRFVPDDVLQASLSELREKCNKVVTEEELYRGAQLSKGWIGGQNGQLDLHKYPDNLQWNICLILARRSRSRPLSPRLRMLLLQSSALSLFGGNPRNCSSPWLPAVLHL